MVGLIKSSSIKFLVSAPDSTRTFPIFVDSYSLAKWSAAYFGSVNESRRHLLVFIAEKARYSLWTMANYDELTLIALAIEAELTIYDMIEALQEDDEVINSVLDSVYGENSGEKIEPVLCTCDECEGRI